MDEIHVPDDNSIEGLISFSEKVLHFQSQTDMEFDMAILFPTLKYSEFEDYWFLNIIDQILQIPKKSQKLVFKLISLANLHYYNLFDVLNNRYKASSGYEEKKKEMKTSLGRFYSENDDFELWKANLQQKDFTIKPDPIMQFILDKASIQPTDNSRFDGYRLDEFFSQLGIQEHILINNTTLSEMLTTWETHQSRGVPGYFKKQANEPFATKEEFIQIISSSRIEYDGKDVTDDIIDVLNTDSINEVKRLLLKISKVVHDSGIYSVAFMYYLLMDKDNSEIQYEAIKWWVDESSYYATEICDAFTEKINSIGLKNVEDLKILRLVHICLLMMRDSYSTQLEKYIDIYSREFITTYHCKIISNRFYPLRGHMYGDKAVTKLNLFEDIKATSIRLLEFEKTILPDFEEFVLSKWTDIASMNEDTQHTVTDLIGMFSSTKVDSVLEQLQQSEYPMVQYLNGAPNENGHTKNDI